MDSTSWILILLLPLSTFSVSSAIGPRSSDDLIVIRNVTLKCESRPTKMIKVRDSIRMFFQGGINSLPVLGNVTRFQCIWRFKPMVDDNAVELYIQSLKPGNCHISSLNVYISGEYTTTLCSENKVEGMKFIGKSLSVSYGGIMTYRVINSFIMILREVSPMNQGCDFRMKEIGFRHHLLYEFADKGLQTGYERIGRPIQGMKFSNVDYTLTLVTREDLGVTPCANNEIILPSEDVPSCHSRAPASCEWEIINGVDIARETKNLRGPYWKISKLGIFKTKSTKIQLEALCVYIEYLSLQANIRGAIRIYISLAVGKVLLTEFILNKIGKWEIARIVSPFPEHLKGSHVQLILEISTSNMIFVNKIMGCNAFNLEDRVLLSSGKSVTLHGSIEREFLKYSPECLHGKMYGNSCLCDIGFNGTYCSIGCGENKFGIDCKSQCSIFNKGCKQMVFCDDILGCSCASGFKGTFCNIECDDYEYGVNCEHKCGHCSNGKPCDKYTGYCIYGCKKSYKSPRCKTGFIHFIVPPVITDVSYTYVKVEMSLDWEGLAGFGQPTFYEVQVMNMRKSIKFWQGTIVKSIPKSGPILHTVHDLDSSTTYNLRIILVANGNQTYNENDLPFVNFTTPCNIQLKYVLKIIKLWSSEATISWKREVNDTTDCIVNVTEVLLSSGASSKYLQTNQSFITLEDLLAGTRYRLRIKPFIKGQPPFSSITFTTLPKWRCSLDIRNLEVSDVGSFHIGLKWEASFSQTQQFSIIYKCYKIVSDQNLNCTIDKGIRSTNKLMYNMTQLLPNRQYNIVVKQSCSSGEKLMSIKAATMPAVPFSKPSHVTVLNVTSTNASLVWSIPDDCSECNGVLTGFHIEITDATKRTIQVYQTYLNSSNQMLFNLVPNMSYFTRVYLVNEIGWNWTAFEEIHFTTLIAL